MYEGLKKLLLVLVPKKWLFKNEPFLRSIFGVAYIGKKHQCTVCNKHFKKFIPLPDGDSLCPFCGSRSRTRHLSQYLTENNLINGHILHFSPSRSLYRKLKKEGKIIYVTSDYEDEFIADFKYDITNIPRPDASFDLIICYHILEHIPDDCSAIKELSRVLKKDGACLIQTPFKQGDIYEDASITSREERLKAFGQDDHVRIYSVEGLKERLLYNGFTQVKLIEVAANTYSGIEASRVLIVKK